MHSNSAAPKVACTSRGRKSFTAWRYVAVVAATAVCAEQTSDIFTIYKNEAEAAQIMNIAFDAERRIMADEAPSSELTNTFLTAGLRVNDETVRFQVSKLLEAFMRRKMQAESPRCPLDGHAGTKSAERARGGHGSVRPRGVIVFILVELDIPGVAPSEQLRRDLELALRCWSRNLPGYPLLVFHTPQVPRVVLQRLSASVPASARLEFAEILAEFPPRIAADPAAYFEGRCINDAGEDRWRMASECGCRCGGMNTSRHYSSRMAEGTAVSPSRCWPLAWMHSMRLGTASIFRHPALANRDRFDYIALVNVDLFLVRPPPVDPFVLLDRCGCAMAYDRFSVELPGCHDGFQEQLSRLGVAHPMIGTGLAAIGGQLMVPRILGHRRPSRRGHLHFSLGRPALLRSSPGGLYARRRLGGLGRLGRPCGARLRRHLRRLLARHVLRTGGTAGPLQMDRRRRRGQQQRGPGARARASERLVARRSLLVVLQPVMLQIADEMQARREHDLRDKCWRWRRRRSRGRRPWPRCRSRRIE
mmetsp:Transcript_6737/g.18820  ORF Transcript_6737/g.18820 Transcript_6737/m.18820 type:complete len:532 (+) Transcript_6737:114-1709(+)